MQKLSIRPILVALVGLSLLVLTGCSSGLGSNPLSNSGSSGNSGQVVSAPTATPVPVKNAPNATLVNTVPPAAIDTGNSGGTSLPWLTVYFTNPTPPDQLNSGVDRYVVPVLDAAKKSIDITSFDFNLPSVITSVVNAEKRGVTVRIVLDEVNGSQTLKASESPLKVTEDALKTLKAANIPVVNGGRSNGLMHNKIIIVDSTTLFMGSWNMSYNDTYRNNNNLLKITNQKLIANYQAKFDELFTNKKFGTHAVVGALTPQLTIDGTSVENYFSPVDHVMDKLVAEVGTAKKSVKFMIFTYTHKDLSAAMIERFKAGVTVEGVIENRGASQGALPALFCAKIPVLTDGNPYTMHHKIIIIDDSTVITGSFNSTASADQANDDNVLIIHSPALAAQYNAEFTKIYGQGKKPTTDCSKKVPTPSDTTQDG